MRQRAVQAALRDRAAEGDVLRRLERGVSTRDGGIAQAKNADRARSDEEPRRRTRIEIEGLTGVGPLYDDGAKTLDRSAVSYQIVLTKADQVKASELEQRIASSLDTLKAHPAAYPEVLTTSSRTGAGMPELRAAMIRLLAERGA